MYKRGALAKVLEDQTFNLKAGEWTAPIRTRQGFVILKVTDHVAAGVAPLKDVEQQVQEAMYTEAMQPALRTYLTKLREDAYINIRDGYVDSGASPKETKPVYTAYAPPAVKKKTVQQKKRFDRGTTFSTANKSAAAPSTAAPVAAPATVVTTPPATSTVATTTAKATAPAKPQKPQKVKREKVRFGQAPRNTLPAGPQETASGGDVGEGATSAAVTPGGTMASSAAPGTAIAPLEGSPQVSSSSNTDPNPLDAHTTVEGKTRYSARAKQVSAEKKSAKLKKVNEKVAAKPVAASPEEKAAEQTQAAPLGLNGDTAKKKKQPKDKNAPKERLQNKAPAPPAPKPDETPSKAPNRATPLEGTLPPAAKTPDTTAPPETAPATPPSTPPQ
jgi:peptidyl-prolyl cis-trans isomerase SurA